MYDIQGYHKGVLINRRSRIGSQVAFFARNVIEFSTVLKIEIEHVIMNFSNVMDENFCLTIYRQPSFKLGVSHLF